MSCACSLRARPPPAWTLSWWTTPWPSAAPLRQELEEAAAALPNPSRVVLLKGTSPADLIVNCAKEEGCDLIIMGSRGQGGVKGFLGSVSYAVTKESPVTVLIAKEGDCR